MMSTVKTEAEIAALRESGRMPRNCPGADARQSKIGVAPKDMSALAKKELQRLGRRAGLPGLLWLTRTLFVFRSMTKCSTASRTTGI